jgi:hypothetical protein
MKHHLSEGAVRKLTKPGRYAVGHGAYLQISELHPQRQGPARWHGVRQVCEAGRGTGASI